MSKKDILLTVKILIIIVLCCFIVVAAVFLVYGDKTETVWLIKKEFSKTTSLNYEKDISRMMIWGPALKKDVMVDDKDSIDKLINMLNSMEVVKRKGRRAPDVQGPQSYIYVSVGENTFSLTEREVKIFDVSLPDKYYESYYVRNPQLEFQDENNEITQYLNYLGAQLNNKE